VICPDVGGAFGSRFNIYPEQVAVVWAARRVGRPVKWTADRSEAFLTDYTARDVVTRAPVDELVEHAVRRARIAEVRSADRDCTRAREQHLDRVDTGDARDVDTPADLAALEGPA